MDLLCTDYHFPPHRASDVPGRRGKVVSHRGGLVWPHGLWCSVQVRSVHKSSKSSTMDQRCNRHGHTTAVQRPNTSDNREATGCATMAAVGPVAFSQGQHVIETSIHKLM